MPTPFAEVWLTACRCLQRQLPLRSSTYSDMRKLSTNMPRKHLCFFPEELAKSEKGKSEGVFLYKYEQNPCRNGVVGGQICAKGPETCVNRTCGRRRGKL